MKPRYAIVLCVSILVTVLLLLVGNAPLLDQLQTLNEDSRYREMIALVESRKIPVESLNGAELSLLTEAYFGNSQYETAFDMGQLAIAADPGNELVARFTVFASREIAREEEGLAIGEAWIANCDQGKMIYKDIAILLTDLNREEEALDYLQKAMELLPDDERIKGIYAYTVAIASGLEAAIDFHGQQLENGPLSEFFEVQYAKGLYDLGANSELKPVLEGILAKNPAEEDASRMYMHLLRMEGDSKASVEYGEQWLQDHQPDDQWLNCYGTSLFFLDRFKEARRQFRRAISLNPYFRTPVRSYIITMNEMNDFGIAANWAEDYRKKYPHIWYHRLDQQLGHSYAYMKQFLDAAMCYRRALDEVPDNVDYLTDLMWALRELGKPTESISLAEQWLEKFNPNGKDAELIEEAVEAAKSMESN